jgi:hypothetical protein
LARVENAATTIVSRSDLAYDPSTLLIVAASIPIATWAAWMRPQPQTRHNTVTTSIGFGIGFGSFVGIGVD